MMKCYNVLCFVITFGFLIESVVMAKDALGLLES